MKNIGILLFIILLLVCAKTTDAQVAINTDGSIAASSSALDVKSTDKGILIPRMSKADRDAITVSSEQNGLLIYQTDNTPGFYFYDGSAWVVVGNGATTINSLADGKTDSFSLFLGNGTGAADDGSDNRNTAVGISALNSSINSYANTAFGNEALKLNTTGTHNAAFGTQALTSNLTGIENTALGTNAGFNVTGSGNVLIGSNVAFGQTAISNKLFIDNENNGTPLIYGEFDNDLLRVYGTLDINNAYQFPTTAGTNGQLLKTDGSGSLSWADDTNTGANDINGLTDGKTGGNSVFLGSGSGSSNSGFSNTAIGYQALFTNAGGTDNTSVGRGALFSNSTANSNTAIGAYALTTNTTGHENTSVGKQALNVNIGGNYNTAVGSDALKNNTASDNTAVGNEAMKSNTTGHHNAAFGRSALSANTTASENTAMGGQALISNTTGHHNAAFGRSALSNNIVGINNTAIGADAGTNSIGSGNIFLGNNSGSNDTGDNKLYIENSSSSTPLIYGEFDNDLVRINGDLEVTGTFNAYSIGDFVHGGIVFWVDETGQHGLVCSKTDQSTGIQWYNGSNDYTESRGDGIYSGEMNTTLIIATQGYNSDNYAAGICANLEVTENSINYGDWYLPSITELTEIYDNRTTINTTAAANSGTALTTTGSYWSSYEQSNTNAYIKKFHDGGFMSTLKSYTNYVRAVRRF